MTPISRTPNRDKIDSEVRQVPPDSRMGRRIAKKIRERVPSAEVDVQVEDGIAYLSGRTGTWNEYLGAGYAAGGMKGIRGVVADITVDGMPKKELRRPDRPKEVIKEDEDVIIVGGGVIGCFIARELSRYDLKVTLVEKELDVATGASKANNGCVHVGIDPGKGTLKHRLCLRGNAMFDKVAQELDVPFRRVGTLLVITDRTLPENVASKIPDSLRKLVLKYVLPHMVLLYGKRKNVPGLRKIPKEEVRQIEPNLTDDYHSAVLMPTMGIISPYELVIALAENAVENGVDLMLDTEVTGILVNEKNEVEGIQTAKGIMRGKYVINAAGVYADELAETAGAREFTIHPRKGALIIFDKKLAGYTSHVVSELLLGQDKHTKGGTAMLTTDGNPEWGPSAIEVPDRDDTSVTSDEIHDILKKYAHLFPHIEAGSMIRYFAGVRAATFTEDFFIGASRKASGLINVAGIQSPGLASSPAIAEYVLDILRAEGLGMEEKPGFNPIRESPPKFSELSVAEMEKLIREDTRYGNIMCRCEKVTEREILDAIRAPLPALTVDAVKRRTRSGMGRCQGGFCLPRLIKVLARELDVPLEEVQKKKGGKVISSRTKEGGQ